MTVGELIAALQEVKNTRMDLEVETGPIGARVAVQELWLLDRKAGYTFKYEPPTVGNWVQTIGAEQ